MAPVRLRAASRFSAKAAKRFELASRDRASSDSPSSSLAHPPGTPSPEGVFREQHLTLAAHVDLAEHLAQYHTSFTGLAGIALEALRDLVAVELGCAWQEIRDALVRATLTHLEQRIRSASCFSVIFQPTERANASGSISRHGLSFGA